MTRDEAIKMLRLMKYKYLIQIGSIFDTALDMAIEALEAQDRPRPIDPTIEVDLESGVIPISACKPKAPKTIIYADRPRGEWIVHDIVCREEICLPYECPNCGFRYSRRFNFCSNCGADMRERSEDK